MTPQQFAHTWRHSELKERSGSQSHFIGVCRLAGSLGPTRVTPFKFTPSPKPNSAAPSSP
jgi:hypothetical protein